MVTGTYQYSRDSSGAKPKWQPHPGEIAVIIVGVCALIMCGLACFCMIRRAIIGGFFRPARTRPNPEISVNVVVSHSPRYEEGTSTPPPVYEELDPENPPLGSSGLNVTIQLPPPAYSARP